MQISQLRKLLKPPNATPRERPRDVSAYASPTISVRNSFCKMYGFSDELLDHVRVGLTYENEDFENEKFRLIRLIRAAKIKAKSRSEKDARKGRKQLFVFRKKLAELKTKQWICWLSTENEFPTGHLNIVRMLLEEKSAKFEVADNRRIPGETHLFRWNVAPPENRYYQEEMVEIGRREGRGVFESAVGTGKTRILAQLIKDFGVTSLVVAPSKALRMQLSQVLGTWFGKSKAQEIEVADVEKSKRLPPIRIVTIHTLTALAKKGLLERFLADVDLLSIDEIHHAGAKSYTDLLPSFDHIYYRFGFSGTFMRNDGKTLDMWGFLSNRLYEYTASQAIADGYLTPIEVRIITIDGMHNRNYQKEYLENYCGQPDILKSIESIVRNIPNQEQTLILVDRKDQSGAIIHKQLERLDFDNAYVSGDDESVEISDAIRDFNAKDVQILIGSTVIGEGIDVHSTQHLILATGGKSEIKITQATGRLVRLSEGKKVGYLYDFRFKGTKFLERHLEERIAIYKRQFAAEVVEYEQAA